MIEGTQKESNFQTDGKSIFIECYADISNSITGFLQSATAKYYLDAD
jgi:hypothetical protein